MEPAHGTERTEIEAKLVVLPARRREIAAALSTLASLGPYALSGRVARDLRDRYHDTAGGALGRLDVSLRLRVAGGAAVLTLKGPTERLADGALARLEIEEAWSTAAFAAVLGKLRGWGVDLPGAGGNAAPEAALEAAGLLPIHERRVHRETVDATVDVPGRPAVAVAEIAFDAVEFDAAGRLVRHDEIEVEGRGPDAEAHVRSVVAALRERFGGGLAPWRSSKLAIGLALEALGAEGALDGALDGDGRPTPEGYDLLLGRLATR